MKKIILLLIAISLLGCNKIELSEEEKEPQPEKPVPPITDDEYFNVHTALAIADKNINLNLEGYIVGYIEGNSIKSGAKFTVPEDKINTNLLLADQPYIEDIQLCMPIKLEKTGPCPTRESLNLYDHPNLLNKKIKMNGTLDKYFSRNGIVRIFYCEIIDNEDDDSPLPPQDSIYTPEIDNEEELIPEGRNKRNSNFSYKSFGSLK